MNCPPASKSEQVDKLWRKTPETEFEQWPKNRGYLVYIGDGDETLRSYREYKPLQGSRIPINQSVQWNLRVLNVAIPWKWSEESRHADPGFQILILIAVVSFEEKQIDALMQSKHHKQNRMYNTHKIHVWYILPTCGWFWWFSCR